MTTANLAQILGIKYPFLQGGMANISNGEFAAACSNAGGLGIIASGGLDTEALEANIAKAKSLTNKPFGVNIMLKHPQLDEIAQLVADAEVPVLTTGAGNPAKFMDMWKAKNIKVFPVVPSVALAQRMQKSGADGVIAEGTESGGHVGELTTMALVPQVCDCTDLPVIAAGGIADGRGMAAAMMLGAEGVQMGTRFLLAKECTIHPDYKARLIKAADLDTVVTGRRLGHPVRSLKTPFSRNYLKAEYSDISDEDLEKMGEGALMAAVKSGDQEKGSFLAGQIVSMLKEEETAADIVKEVCEEAEKCLAGGMKWVK